MKCVNKFIVFILLVLALFINPLLSLSCSLISIFSDELPEHTKLIENVIIEKDINTPIRTDTPVISETALITYTPEALPTETPIVKPTNKDIETKTTTPTISPTTVPTVVPTKLPTKVPTATPVKTPAKTLIKAPTPYPAYTPAPIPVYSFSASSSSELIEKLETYSADALLKQSSGFKFDITDKKTITILQTYTVQQIFDFIVNGSARMNNDYLATNINKFNSNFTMSNIHYVIDFDITWNEDKHQTDYVYDTAQSVLNLIISSGMTSSQKIAAINRYIVTQHQYDTTYKKYTAYELITTGSAVCQGYALYTYAMLEKAGFEVRIIKGEGLSGGEWIGHAWNLLKIDGKWYHLDVTWNDPIPDAGSNVFKARNEKYLLKTDIEMKTDHRWNEADYPISK